MLVLVIAVAIAVFLIGRYYTEKRRQEWESAAGALGLRYAREDPFGLLDDLPFALFRRGEGRGIDNIGWGRWREVDVRLFEYWYYTTSTDSKGNTSRHYERFTCAVAPLPVEAPPTSISRESFLSRIADHIGFRDQEFESEEFNKTFQVRADDRRFASYLLDARMMHWLLATEGDCAFELAGPTVLCATGRVRPADIGWVLERLHGFLAQVPRVVLDVYGQEHG